MADEPTPSSADRRQRRMRLMIDVTAQILTDEASLTFCEALRLVEATRTAMLRHYPENVATFEHEVRPALDRIVRERFRLDRPVPAN